jgi:tRNA pseudouridine55 synthase
VTSEGVLVIDKPAGPTSHDVVAVVRRALDVDRVGHTGTLDPLATGVLPLVIGRATRLSVFLTNADKEYVARIRFGSTTDTYDAEGVAPDLAPVAAVTVPRGAGEIADALPRFRGSYLQHPPAFSAKKIAGTPAYKLARQKKATEIKPVQVHVRDLELTHYADGTAEVRLVCSSGFYVRSFAHDLGQALGCGAYLEALRRTVAGSFTLGDAVPLTDVVADPAAAAMRMIPMDQLLTTLPVAILTEEGFRKASHGNTLTGSDFRLASDRDRAADGDRLRLLDASGRLVGIADAAPGGLLHPSIVLV